ncbi:SRPBCC family protein [Modestobacter sp. I12A-02628]|uniref:SRPBCC family protein n=1 Tax=Goekera deserti TaxID=2497753 RepID=A0A7K3WFF7_9ACTN|nr:SRPBCC family protein [Goekera deserti]MPR00077.1 SRPBCC family protein [Goekera deserti]NDI49856.1 SRPBCC family protein [Goekera deserti]NEL55218.1 SRPBCC family protein [Goekera deserti]
MTTTAAASREVAHPRDRVWRALAVLQPYCAVCDVSYVVTGAVRRGATFVCQPGRLEPGRAPAATAPRGEIVQWRPQSVVETRLSLTPEVWTTRIELADGATTGSTRVTITVTHEPTGTGRVVRLVQRTSMARMVRRLVAAELAKVDDHVAALTD